MQLNESRLLALSELTLLQPNHIGFALKFNVTSDVIWSAAESSTLYIVYINVCKIFSSPNKMPPFDHGVEKMRT
jgi:hypothetical protein